jgi:hypothetical protein
MPATATPNPAAMIRFSAGTRRRTDDISYDESVTLGASSRTMPALRVPSGNWLTHVDLLVTVTAAGNSASVAANADAPFSVLDTIRFLDAGGNQLSEWSGYELYLCNLLGGFQFQADPTASPAYSAMVTGTGGTGGSFTFPIRVPVVIVDRDLIGAYPNGDASAQLRIEITAAPLGDVYTTSPTNAPTLRVQAIPAGNVVPGGPMPSGLPIAPEPPGGGTFQQWSSTPYEFAAAGRRVVRHTRVGQIYRQLIMVTRNSSGARSNAIVNSLRFSVDEVATVRGPWNYLRHLTWTEQSVTATQLPTGVITVNYAAEWDGKMGGEMRDNWLPTAPGTKVEIEADVAAAGSLTVLTNEIVVASGKVAEVLRT